MGHRAGCLVCGEDLVCLPETKTLTCEFCGRAMTGDGDLLTLPDPEACRTDALDLRRALETYILANRVRDLAPGIYRYLALQAHDTGPRAAEWVTAACFDQGFVRANGVTVIWTAAVRRMTWRYGEQGYRYLHLDAGHACQNLYLLAGQVGCGVCAVAAFSDEQMNEILTLDGAERFVIYLAAVGKTTSTQGGHQA